MTFEEIQALSRAVAPIVAKAIKAGQAPLLGRIAELEKRPTADQVETRVAAAVEAAVAALPPPKDGKDADPDHVLRTVQEAVKLAFAQAGKPRDGKDADPELIRTLVAEAVAALPAPAAGKDADPAVIAEQVAHAVRDAVAALPPAEPGKDADPELIKAMVAEAVAALPPPAAGKDADPQFIADQVTLAVRDAVAALPPPAPGRDADPELVKALVAEAVAALPPPAPGKDADPELIKALVAEAVAAIPPAKDGVGLAGAMIDRAGDLVVTTSDGRTHPLGRVVGQDGKSALGEITLEVTPSAADDRAFVVAIAHGELQIAKAFRVPFVLDRGVYKDGGAYEAGDAVTWAGSLWIAQRDTSAKPDASDDWRLAVKRGRDGKAVDADELKRLVDAAVTRAVLALPKAKPDGAR